MSTLSNYTGILVICFLSACNNDKNCKNYTYIQDDNLEVTFQDCNNSDQKEKSSKDRFVFKQGGFSSNAVVRVIYVGIFDRDSVDATMKEYFDNGNIPKLESLR